MKQKINMRLLGIALLAVIATTVCITFVYYGLFRKQVCDDLKISAQILKDTHYFELGNISSDDIDMTIDNDELRVTWIDADGTVLYDNDRDAVSLKNHSDRPEIRDAFEQGFGESVRKSDTMNMNTFYYAILLDNNTVLRVATEAENIQSVFITVMPIILLILLVILVVCALLSNLLTKQLIRPIETMAEHMEDTTAEPPYKELVPFANVIRQQHADILSSAKVRQDFTANVSHELKTPLTAISGYAELIENHMVGEKQGEHFVREIRKNSDRLLTLINDIIRLSELDHSEKQPGFEEIDLYAIVSEIIDILNVSAEKKNITLSFAGQSCKLRGNKDMLRELSDNLIQNAIRYNNEGGSVWVRVKEENGAKVLLVKDNGIGIPKEDQERIFERFYRVDKSRSKATGGTGLGLAIVKHIVELHDAKILLESEIGQGTEIRVVF